MPEGPKHSQIPPSGRDHDGLVCLRGEYYISQARYDFLTDEAALHGKEVLDLFTEIVEDAIQRFVHEGITRHADALKITKALEQKPGSRPRAETPAAKAKPKAKPKAKAKTKAKTKAKATSKPKAVGSTAKPRLGVKLRFPKGRTK